jgi:hypothetical protein
MLRERVDAGFFRRRDLVEVAFDFVLMSADAGGLVPMKFCSAHRAIL